MSTRRLALNNLEDLVGNTPLMRLRSVGRPDGAPIYVKLENQNPSGSIRDRYVFEIVERALRAGQLVPGDTIALAGIDDSAVSASFIASIRKLSAKIFAPRGSSKRLVPLIRRFGAEIVWTEDSDGLAGAVEQAAQWARPRHDAMYVDGYRRQTVRDAYRTIAHEILASLDSVPLGAFVTSVTTGGTFHAVSRELRETQPMLKVGGVQIVENEFATDEVFDAVIRIALADAFAMRDQIARKEGLLLSPKGAACVTLACELQNFVHEDQAIVALNPDAGQRYLGWENKSLFKTQFGGSGS